MNVVKHICAVAAVVGMLSLGIIPYLFPAPSDPLALFKWKLVLFCVSILTAISFALQIFFQSKHEQEKDRDLRQTLEKLMQNLPSREQEVGRDKRFQELATLIPEPTWQCAPSKVDSFLEEQKTSTLRDRVLQLGHDLFAFMRQKGPDPEVVLDKSLSLEEQIQQVIDKRGPYVEAIHFGYMAHFRDRVVKIFNELAEVGIHLPAGLQSWELDPSQVQNAERVRKIAENLFIIAAKMDIADAAEGT